MSEGNVGPRIVAEKIHHQHPEGLAIVYIRQSTVQQVERHQESSLQYALVDRALQFGWARDTVVVIDDDLGRSGGTVEGRLGFQRRSQRLVLAMSGWFSALRCHAWRARVATGISCWKSLPFWIR